MWSLVLPWAPAVHRAARRLHGAGFCRTIRLANGVAADGGCRAVRRRRRAHGRCGFQREVWWDSLTTEGDAFLITICILSRL